MILKRFSLRFPDEATPERLGTVAQAPGRPQIECDHVRLNLTADRIPVSSHDHRWFSSLTMAARVHEPFDLTASITRVE